MIYSSAMLRQLGLSGVAVALFVVGLAAQTTTVGSGAVVGTIRDTSGAVIPGVEITCENDGTRASRRAVSDTDGDFTLTNLAIGFSTFSARNAGFKTGVQARFELQVDQRAG